MTYIITHRWNRSATPANVPAQQARRVPITEDQYGFLMKQLAESEGHRVQPGPIGRRPSKYTWLGAFPRVEWFNSEIVADRLGIHREAAITRIRVAYSGGVIERRRDRSHPNAYEYRRVSQ